jgi:4-carboxymuconolactone decarboxylase
VCGSDGIMAEHCIRRDTPETSSRSNSSTRGDTVGRTVAFIAGSVLLITSDAAISAQDRLPPIPPEHLTAAQQRSLEEFAKIRGTAPFGPFIPLMRSPEVMVRVSALGDQLRYKSSLPPRLSEFIILLVARQWTQQYEWFTHESVALKAGLRHAIVAAVAEGRRPEAMADDEDIIYSLCDELSRHRTVTDATYARAAATFGEQGVMDATSIAGYYTLLAMVMNTARTALPEGTKPPLPPLPRP